MEVDELDLTASVFCQIGGFLNTISGVCHPEVGLQGKVNLSLCLSN
jgi:hypothetical protein